LASAAGFRGRISELLALYLWIHSASSAFRLYHLEKSFFIHPDKMFHHFSTTQFDAPLLGRNLDGHNRLCEDFLVASVAHRFGDSRPFYLFHLGHTDYVGSVNGYTQF
jgi:hypothetical protein